VLKKIISIFFILYYAFLLWLGMSTCHEVTVARQCGIRCFGFSLITNCASIDSDAPVEICHEEVLEAARNAR
jgi:purine-nucleoside phosphorylase